MSTHPQDRALAAVRRVRSAREQDSRIGLHQATLSVTARQAELDAVRLRRTAGPSFGTGSVAEFRSFVAEQTGLVELETAAAERLDAARLVAEEADHRWKLDRRHRKTVELILARRAAARAHERARREARGLDDIAGQAWLRRRGEEDAS